MLNDISVVTSFSPFTSKAAQTDITKEYVCSCVLRIAREMYALLPVEHVLVHVVDTSKDVLGKEHSGTILSAMIHRKQLGRTAVASSQALSFARIL